MIKEMKMGKIDTNELKTLLQNTTQKISAANTNIEINTIVENLIVTVMDSEFASLWIFDESKTVLLRERNEDSVREISMLDQRGVLAKCFLTLSHGIYNYLASEKEYVPATDNPDNIRMKSKIIVPLIDGDHLVGIVTAYSSIMKIKNFSEDDMEILEAMIPFLINVIYKMHPQTKIGRHERVHISERLLESSKNIVKNVEKIHQIQETTESTDDTLSFLANTVHDIRTPANSLYGFLELLEDQLSDPRLLKYVNNAKESAKFINNLTTSILDRVSSQRERVHAAPVVISATKFFADIAESFSANMFNKNITFNIYIDPFVAKEIIVEELMLKRVIMNLIGNAYKFTPSRKTIDFSVQFDEIKKSLYISVKDTGIGIAEEKQGEIFKAFTQAEEDTHTNYGGTGLGLSICAQYVKELGGNLKLESKLDEGSRFYFTIPVEISNPKKAFKLINNNQISLGILLSDSNISSGKNISRYLLRMGVEKNRIKANKKLTGFSKDITHLVCYQNQLTDEVILFSTKNSVELMIVEESFLSLTHNNSFENYLVISQYAYYANILHSFVSNNVQKRVLVVDDDPINIQLLQAILEEEFCRVESALDGEEALSMLKIALKEEDPYSMVYLDKHMPKLSGVEVIDKFRNFEKKKEANPIFAVSISGDGMKEKDSNFNMFIGKPFNRKKIKDALQEVCLSTTN